MAEKPTTVAQYLKAIPKDRRDALEAIRKVINANIDKDFEEGIQYGMPAWFVPHSVYPDGYHCDPKQPLPYASIASQKNHMAIYLFCVYTVAGEEERFRNAWIAAGHKLDMGKSCVRFKKIEDVPLKVVGDLIKSISAKAFIDHYEKARESSKKPTVKKAAAKKTKVAKKVVKKAATKKKAAKKKNT